MRAALAATMSPATPVPMDEDHALPHKPQAPRVRVERRGLLAGREQQPERMEPFVFGQSATPGASFVGRRRGGWFVSWTPRRPTLRHYSIKRDPDGGRSETEPMARGEPKFPCRPTNTTHD